MPHSLRSRLNGLRFKGIISDKDFQRLCVALNLEHSVENIRAEIEHVIDNTYDSTNYDKSLYNGAYKDGLYEALDIIDRHIGKETK